MTRAEVEALAKNLGVHVSTHLWTETVAGVPMGPPTLRWNISVEGMMAGYTTGTVPEAVGIDALWAAIGNDLQSSVDDGRLARAREAAKAVNAMFEGMGRRS